MEKNILLTIEYDGSVFFGWQRQPNRATVQGHLEKTLSELFKKDIVLNGTSRTDAGVHALGQRASFKADINIPTERIVRVINNALAGREKGAFTAAPVRILSVEEMPATFHARFDAKGKEYIYRIRNTRTIDVFSRNYVYHVDKPLDMAKMRAAAGWLRGTHDFKSFEATGSNPRETTVRTIFDIDICETPVQNDAGQNLAIHVSGDGFLYNMVRIIAGTLVDIGLSKIDCEEMKDIIDAKDRTRAGHTAPPYGLYLAEVFY